MHCYSNASIYSYPNGVSIFEQIVTRQVDIKSQMFLCFYELLLLYLTVAYPSIDHLSNSNAGSWTFFYNPAVTAEVFVKDMMYFLSE